MHRSKRQQAIAALVEPMKLYPVAEAVACLQQCPPVRFVQTVEAHVCLGIDPRKSDQGVKGSVVLPNGTGQVVRALVFAQGEQAAAAEKAGAERIGMEDLVQAIEEGYSDFDVVIATPDAMRLVSKLGKVLGPRGLMPNPKLGTVSTDVAKAVEAAKAGQVRYRSDKGGIVHCRIGKIDFDTQALVQNLEAVILDLKRIKPSAAKGVYLKKIVLSTSMGPGLVVDISTLSI